MLYECPYIKTEANRLQIYICQFMRALRRADGNYSVDNIPDGLKAFTNRSKKLKKLVEAFIKAYHDLPDEEDRKKVFDAFVNSNAIEALLKNRRTADRIKKSDLHYTIQKPADELFKFLFSDTLKLDGILKNHYEQFYQAIEKSHQKVCPFCGLETMVSPRKGMQDYDHLLYKDEYIFASVNMRNLIPMGIECNRRYKRTNDIIHRPDGCSRPFPNPFQLAIPIQVDLSGSPIPNVGDNGDNWMINFQPNTDDVTTWAEVFDIRERYIEDVFKVGYFSIWLEDFIQQTQQCRLLSSGDATEVKSCMVDFLSLIKGTDFRSLGFIKFAVFDFLIKEAPDDFFEDLGQTILSVENRS